MSSDRPKDPRSADSPPDVDIGGGAGAEPDRRPPPGMPRWVKVSLLVVGVLALAAVIVLLLAGEHGPGRHGATSPVAEGAVEIAVTADALAFEPAEIAVPAGEDVAIALTAVDQLHDFTIEEFEAHVAADWGETATGGFRADRPGRYTFYCSEPGHRQAGMEGTPIVLPSGGDLEDHEDLRDLFEALHG